MGAHGFYAVQEGHWVQLLTPVDQTGAAKNSLVCRMKNYRHASILISIGTAPRAAGVITIESCNDMTPSTATAVAFYYFRCELGYASANGDVFGALVAATAAGGIIPAAGTPNGVMYAIELDAEQLVDGDIGFRLYMANPAAASVMSAIALLSGGLATDQSPSVIV